MQHRWDENARCDESRREPDPATGSGSDYSPAVRMQRLREIQHDMANWLSVVLGHLELAASEDSKDLRKRRGARARAALARARELEKRAEEIALGLPLTAAPAAPVEVGPLVEQVVEDARALLPADSATTIEFEAGSGVAARIEAGELADALVNLVRNAVFALGGRGRIEIRVDASHPHEARIDVVDDGPGMSPDVLEHCLEPGYTTRARAGGHGLGLARVAATLREAGGQLLVHSEVGRGSCFSIVLPRAVPVPAHASPGSAGPSCLVLLVEDEPAVAEVVEALLTGLGHRVQCVSSVAEARSAFRADHFDAALIDQHLPDGMGESLAASLRESDPALATVLVSGDLGLVDADPDGVIDRIVAKPIGREGLLEIVREARILTQGRRQDDSLRSHRAGA